MTRNPEGTVSSAEIRHRAGSDGFLLVEVLATMTISAFLLAALISVVALMLRASDRVGRSSQEIEDTSRVMASLSREIEQIAPLRWAGRDAAFVFAGNSQSIVFAREARAADGAIENQVVFLQGDGDRLFRKQAPLLPGAQALADIAAGNAQQILPARLTVRFAYFARLDTGQEALTNTWGNPALLPVAVRVSLLDRAGVLKSATRVQIRVDAEPGCAAPGKGLCSFVKKTGADEEQDDTGKPIDPDDAAGWLRDTK